MKIKRIKRLIESLNESEVKQLNTLFETTDSEYEKMNIKDFSSKRIAKMIENKEIEETKELLMRTRKDVNRWIVAYWLARRSSINGWSTTDKEILKWKDNNGFSVAWLLAYDSDKTNWSTNDKEILMLQAKDAPSVAHKLAEYHPTWTTDDPEILSLVDGDGKTVEDILIEKGKLKKKLKESFFEDKVETYLILDVVYTEEAETDYDLDESDEIIEILVQYDKFEKQYFCNITILNNSTETLYADSVDELITKVEDYLFGLDEVIESSVSIK